MLYYKEVVDRYEELENISSVDACFNLYSVTRPNHPACRFVFEVARCDKKK